MALRNMLRPTHFAGVSVRSTLNFLGGSRNQIFTIKNVAHFSTKRIIGRNFVKMSLYGTAAVMAVGYISYDIKSLKEPATEVMENEVVILDKLPDVKPTRRVQNAGKGGELQLTLFQYQTCPFCCKVRAFLDANGISYNVVEVDAVLRQAIKWSAYKKVPILLVKTASGYHQLNDSSAIISVISSHLLEPSLDLADIINYYPSVKYADEGKLKGEILNKYFLMFNHVQRQRSLEEINNERKWRKWADEVLVHTLSPNVYRTKQEARQAFQWFCEVGRWREHFPAWECNLMIYVGAYAMFYVAKKLKKRHSLKDDVRLSLYDECNVWLKEIKRHGGPFLGGSSPNLADLSVYGVLCSIEGCEAFQDLLASTRIGEWYSSMRDHVANMKGVTLL